MSTQYNYTAEETKMLENEMKIGTKAYSEEFWNKAMRGLPVAEDTLSGGRVKNGMFKLPMDSSREYQAALNKESFFRGLATCVEAPRTDSTIWVTDGEAQADWVREGEPINTSSATDDLVNKEMHCNKLAVITTFRDDLVGDIGFDVKKNLTVSLAKAFNKAEENAFITGTGTDEPIGILNDTDGAEVGVTTSEVTFDNISELFLSVKPEYRKKGAWVMNDETALVLRKLKDADGNYIWNHNTDTIFGKPVYISEFMPGISVGNKAIAFGDFSYYWIVNRTGLAVRTLGEKFAVLHQTGYLATEYLDGRLIRSEAIKVMQISE